MSKMEQTETIRQAQHWDLVKERYEQEGLCAACAAQAAYGHQLGFTKIKSPCPSCRSTVDGLPDDAAGQWRKVAQPLRGKRPRQRSRHATRHSCGGCTVTWTGFAKCHCAACHATFGGVTTFEAHRRAGKCRDLADLGFILGDDGVWHSDYTGPVDDIPQDL